MGCPSPGLHPAAPLRGEVEVVEEEVGEEEEAEGEEEPVKG